MSLSPFNPIATCITTTIQKSASKHCMLSWHQLFQLLLSCLSKIPTAHRGYSAAWQRGELLLSCFHWSGLQTNPPHSRSKGSGALGLPCRAG